MDKIVTYEELASAWWSIHESLRECQNEAYRSYILNKSFCELLTQCGWSLEEWNEETDVRTSSSKGSSL